MYVWRNAAADASILWAAGGVGSLQACENGYLSCSQ